MSKMPSKYKGSKLNVETYPVDENAYIPTETYGWCEGNKCYEHGYLADGLCIECWDSMSTLKYKRHIASKDI